MLARMTLLALVILTGPVLAQTKPTTPRANPPEVDMSEAYRRGEDVMTVGEGPRSGVEDAVRAAVAPPADDSHRWMLTFWKANNCPACDTLKKDFETRPELLCYVTAPEKVQPWAHVNTYNRDDATQKHRRDAYGIKDVPVIIIQPPLNGMWGPPGNVVFMQVGYNGDYKALSQKIAASVRSYAAVMARDGYPRPTQPVRAIDQSLSSALPLAPTQLTPQSFSKTLSAVGGVVNPTRRPTLSGLSASEWSNLLATPVQQRQQGIGQATEEQPIGQYGVNPPFATPPQVDPFNPNQPYNYPPQPNNIPPSNTPSTIPTLPTGTNGFGLGDLLQTLGILSLVAMKILERVAPATPTKADDVALAVVTRLSQWLNGLTLPTAPQTPSTPVPAPVPTATAVVPPPPAFLTGK